MKYLLCSHEQFLPLTGGGTVSFVKIAERLALRGNEVIVATPLYISRQPIEDKFRIKLEPFSPFYMHREIKQRVFKYLLYACLFTFHCARLNLKYKFDAALVRNSVLAFGVCLIAKVKGTPFFISLTDLLGLSLYKDKKYPKIFADILFIAEKFILRQADMIFVVTPQMKEALCGFAIPQDRIKVVYDGADTDIFGPNRLDKQKLENIRAKFNLGKDIAVFHGTIEPHHGQAVIESIIKGVLKKKKINFLIIGLGNGYQSLRDRLEGEDVKFTGFLPYEELPYYLALGSVGIIPYERNYSVDLILTLKLLEYLAMGLPVVSLRHKSMAEIFGKHNFIKFADNIQDFSDKIIEALGIAKSENSPQLIRGSFSWDKITGDIARDMENYGR